MDFAAVTPMLYAELNAAGAADLVFWTADELTRYADLELSKLSSNLLLFVDAQQLAGTSVDPNYDLAHTTDDIPLDTGFVSLIHAAWSGLSLSPANVREVEARDANWQTATPGTPTSFIGDWLSAGLVILYPAPGSAQALTVICQRGAPVIDTPLTTAIPAPSALADLLHFRVLADARSKRSDAWMGEAAALADQLGDVLEKAFAAYYGGAM